MSSPRPWGCFWIYRASCEKCGVFPTPVGVFLWCSPAWNLWTCLPHARGGVSHEAAGGVENDLSSPRPWGCFYRARHAPPIFTVFPTPVGVFLTFMRTRLTLKSLPHARGGVSYRRLGGFLPGGSSPRPWGCFLIPRPCPRRTPVFPTPVGVFLCPARDYWTRWRLPHARGGVSLIRAGADKAIVSSPRPWGCFSVASPRRTAISVFPTPVGVFPSPFPATARTWSLPHARGGVSASRGRR